MTLTDRQAFAALMIGLGETYGEPVSDVRLELYFSALQDLDLEELRQAVITCVRFHKFFPRPVELREAVEGSLEDRADVAWLAVMRLVRRFGYYQPAPEDAWPDAAARRAALEMYGGWRGLCAGLPGEGPELLGAAKLFKASYRAYAGNERRLLLEAGDPDRPTSQLEAQGALRSLKQQLEARGLPSGKL